MGYGNRLRNVVGQEGSYAYDGYGRRSQQVNSAGVINSFCDHAGQLVYQEDRDGTTHDYLYLQGRLVAIRDYDTGGIARTIGAARIRGQVHLYFEWTTWNGLRQ